MFLLDSFRLSEVLILSGKEVLLLNKLTYGDRMSSYFASRDPRYWASINFSLSLAWCTRDQASHLPTQLLRLAQTSKIWEKLVRMASLNSSMVYNRLVYYKGGGLNSIDWPLWQYLLPETFTLEKMFFFCELFQIFKLYHFLL